jgi:hypothetical protein
MSIPFQELSQQAQAEAASADHAFPVMSVGKLPDSGEVVVTARIAATKKDVHRIPVTGGILQSMSLFWPMLTLALPGPSMATLRLALPNLGIDSWVDITGWIATQYPSWDDDAKHLFHGDVADEITVQDIRDYLANLFIGELAHIISVIYFRVASTTDPPRIISRGLRTLLIGFRACYSYPWVRPAPPVIFDFFFSLPFRALHSLLACDGHSP